MYTHKETTNVTHLCCKVHVNGIRSVLGLGVAKFMLSNKIRVRFKLCEAHANGLKSGIRFKSCKVNVNRIRSAVKVYPNRIKSGVRLNLHIRSS